MPPPPPPLPPLCLGWFGRGGGEQQGACCWWHPREVVVVVVVLVGKQSTSWLRRALALWAVDGRKYFSNNANRATKSEYVSLCRLYVELNSHVSRYACVVFGENVCS